MRSTSVLACLIGALSLTGCAFFQDPSESTEDREVAARCTAVKALLSKNVRVDTSTTVPLLFKAGGLYERAGAILDPADAARAVRVDQACRAWVKGGITAREYGQVVLDNTSATIVQTTSTEERQGIVDVVVKYLDDLKAKGILPSQFDASAVAGQVASDSRLTKSELEIKLRTSMTEIDGKLGTFYQASDMRQAQLVSRLDSIDRRLTRLEPANQPRSEPSESALTQTQKPSAKDHRKVDDSTGLAADDLNVYFSTGSSEVLFSERRRIEAAAANWVKSRTIIYVVGFTDPRGRPEYNAKLSRARAQAVANHLAKLNVNVGTVNGGGIASGSENDSLRYVRLFTRHPPTAQAQ
ncbi:OmpA family protein [compost metagenome]|nr:OmpA family protein [Variovorax boronicumulans]